MQVFHSVFKGGRKTNWGIGQNMLSLFCNFSSESSENQSNTCLKISRRNKFDDKKLKMFYDLLLVKKARIPTIGTVMKVRHSFNNDRTNHWWNVIIHQWYLNSVPWDLNSGFARILSDSIKILAGKFLQLQLTKFG